MNLHVLCPVQSPDLEGVRVSASRCSKKTSPNTRVVSDATGKEQSPWHGRIDPENLHPSPRIPPFRTCDCQRSETINIRCLETILRPPAPVYGPEKQTQETSGQGHPVCAHLFPPITDASVQGQRGGWSGWPGWRKLPGAVPAGSAARLAPSAAILQHPSRLFVTTTQFAIGVQKPPVIYCKEVWVLGDLQRAGVARTDRERGCSCPTPLRLWAGPETILLLIHTIRRPGWEPTATRGTGASPWGLFCVLQQRQSNFNIRGLECERSTATPVPFCAGPQGWFGESLQQMAWLSPCTCGPPPAPWPGGEGRRAQSFQGTEADARTSSPFCKPGHLLALVAIARL